LNEDAFGERTSHGVYAVSDGASESFDSRRWSKLLVQLFFRNLHVDERWLRHAVTVYAGKFDRGTMSWSAQAAFDRGSFATLTGIVIPPTRSQLQVLGVGDSVAVLADGNQIVSSHPYQRAERFAARPLLFSTVWEQNRTVLSRSVLEFDGAVSGRIRIRGQAARSNGLSASFWFRVGQPSTLRIVI
jgi:hypothetical protein